MRPGRFAELCALDNAFRGGAGAKTSCSCRGCVPDGPVSAVVDLLAGKLTRGVTLALYTRARSLTARIPSARSSGSLIRARSLDAICASAAIAGRTARSRPERSALIPQPLASLADAVAPVHRGDVETGHRGVPLQSLAFGLRCRLGDLSRGPPTAGATKVYDATEH
jgi:hypothetical protein